MTSLMMMMILLLTSCSSMEEALKTFNLLHILIAVHVNNNKYKGLEKSM